jgi:regulator of sirC expression with transglutaminase-like and TPR domain
MQDLLDLLASTNETVPLDVAALQLATIEYPNLTLDPYLALLDSHASELSERVSDLTDGEEFIETMNRYMVEELGFGGNQDDYYKPGNSCLNDVLTERVGIPITLSVAYIEIARRLDRPLYGIGLPGHFIVQYDDGDFSAYIDVFNSGQILLESECFALSKQVTGQDPGADHDLLRPVTKRYILVRMLNNLRAVYFRQKSPPKAAEVLNLLIAAEPDVADSYKQRAICRAQMEMYRGARSDFELYLRLNPHAHDRVQVEAQIERLRAWLRN